MNSHFKIIVPLYNVQEWIKLCLRSIKGQTYRNFECIIIDDISTDNSVEIITTCSKPVKQSYLGPDMAQGTTTLINVNIN